MALMSKASGGSGDFEPVPAGAHIARCVTVVDLGLHDTPWGAKEKVYIAFEVPSIRVKWKKDDQDHEGPALIGCTYTNSIHEKSVLGQHLVNWRGRAFTEDERNGFDLFTILDVPCMISVTHKQKGEKTYANVSGIMGAPVGTQIQDRETPLIGYSPQDNARAGEFDKMPEWLQKKCTEGHRMADNPSVYSDQTQAPTPREQALATAGSQPAPTPPAAGGDFDDDIPF